jgi:hypothetical protein
MRVLGIGIGLARTTSISVPIRVDITDDYLQSSYLIFVRST